MKRFTTLALGLVGLAAGMAQQRSGRGPAAPPFQPKPEEMAKIQSKSEQLDILVKELRAKHPDPDLLGECSKFYAKAGRFLLEYPELIANQGAIEHAMTVLDQGGERAGFNSPPANRPG